MKEVGKILDRYSYRSGKDHISVWNEWLEWLVQVFEWKNIEAHGGDVVSVFADARDGNPIFFEAMMRWLEVSDSHMRTKGAVDAFGETYEACYQSSYKASKSGQFFTPMSLCKLMSEMVVRPHNGNDISTYYDCACGSGRTLIAAYDTADKYGRNWFEAGDVDDTSVRMCALNFMINGMVGKVENRNALSMEFRYGFVINAVKVPLVNPMCSIHYFNDEMEMQRFAESVKISMKSWNIGAFRPTPEVVPKTAESVPEPEVPVTDQQENVPIEPKSVPRRKRAKDNKPVQLAFDF